MSGRWWPRAVDDDFVELMRGLVRFTRRERLRQLWWRSTSPHAAAAMSSAYTAGPLGLFDLQPQHHHGGEAT